MELKYVEKALKMPHTNPVGYYMIGQDKVFCSIKDNKIQYTH